MKLDSSYLRLLLAGTLSLSLAACGGGDGDDGATGPRGEQGPAGPAGPEGAAEIVAHDPSTQRLY